ncbi:hypothetical protein Tco_0241073 [Tanacetum coccineum]
MLTRAMAKQLSVALAHECLFVDFLSKEEPKKVSEALKHPRWVDAMQDELNQFARNKVWTLVPTPYGKTIIGFDLKGYLDSDYTSFNMDGKSTSGTMAAVDIDTLTMEQYLALSRENQAPGVVKPEFGGNVTFKIKSQFMHELREDTFFGNKNEDAHDHIDRVLNIVGFFNIPGVSKDAVML